MNNSRRDCLRTVQKKETTHAGLWLDKFIDGFEQHGDSTPQQELVKGVASIPMPDSYKQFFARWQESLAQIGAVTKRATAEGRLSIGLGAESVLETAITMHRTYGTPYVPGSALKGLAANYARNKLKEKDWEAGSEAYRILFGDTEEAGHVTFFDALYVPGSGHNGRALHPDVITVHHPAYYQTDKAPPADWDSPTPIPFLSATGDYLVALAGPLEWVNAAFEILAFALQEMGVGAKTSSGYGRMIIEGVTPRDDGSEASAGAAIDDPEQALVASFVSRLQKMPNYKVAGEIHDQYERWKKLDISDAGKRAIAQAILGKIAQAGRTKKSVKKKWFQEIRAFVTEYASTVEEEK